MAARSAASVRVEGVGVRVLGGGPREVPGEVGGGAPLEGVARAGLIGGRWTVCVGRGRRDHER